MAAPFHPIIYVRGYAMSESERNETAADPFCGFNLGSTVFRAAIDRSAQAQKFVFESPLVRLASDFEYADVYEDGNDIVDPGWRPRKNTQGIPARSLIVYRYYDDGSSLLGDGQAKPIETYAEKLGELILRVRSLVCEHEQMPEADFRCYLVAHSMGGLVVRALLQNPACDPKGARKWVDKFFTYATPHNGIEIAGLNVPSWLRVNEMNTFNRERMAGYLGLEDVFAARKRVDYVHASAFPLERIFCMVGTNRADYQAAMGLSRTFAGHGSDGLVRVENASLWGLDDQQRITGTAATAYCYRSHSGPFGIVNSEEAYQNLIRFLFGDVRVDIWLQVDSVTLPEEIEGQPVNALYQFELLARARGKRWYLSRRISEEDSPACRTHQELTQPGLSGSNLIYLSSVFLAHRARATSKPDDRTLSYSMDLRVRVPDYQVEQRFWPDQHYEGSYLFRDSLIVVLEPPAAAGGAWQVNVGWESRSVGEAPKAITGEALAQGQLRVEVPFAGARSKPGIRGQVLLIASAWN